MQFFFPLFSSLASEKKKKNQNRCLRVKFEKNHQNLMFEECAYRESKSEVG